MSNDHETRITNLEKRMDRIEDFGKQHGYVPENHDPAPEPSLFRVKFYGTAETPMDYEERERAANADGAVCYFEQHFNACDSKEPHYTLGLVADNASATSRGWARLYAHKIHDAWPDLVDLGGDDGLLVRKPGERGYENIDDTHMPAMLGEPLFASNPSHAGIIRGQKTILARILVESIRETFPKGGLVAFSIGHKYKRSNPNDRGAGIFGGGSEADAAEAVLNLAAAMLGGTDETR